MSSTLSRRFGLALAVPTLLLALAACSPAASDSPDAGGTGSKSDSALTAADWDLARDECLTKAGFTLGDGGKPGGGVVTVDGDGKALGAATTTCEEAVTARLGERPATDEDKREKEAWLQTAARESECLRKAGYDVPADGAAAGSTAGAGAIPESVLEKCAAEGSE